MVKYQFGKNWNWCQDIASASEINEQHLNTSYKLNSNSCTIGGCRSNCLTNPYCLNGLGEKKLSNLIQKEATVNFERNDYFRNENEFAGLVNLGATCYINTYLQVWYNNPLFRNIILNLPFGTVNLMDDTYIRDFQEDSNSETEKKAKLPDLKISASDCIATNLQFILTLMKASIRKSIDPNFFIKFCGLDENMQQDAQEFSQLFLSKLQSRLAETQNEDKCVKDLFSGNCSYITECDICKRKSVCNSQFLELSLNIQNCSTISDCIKDLLKVEVMSDENQYYCTNCDGKTNAKRFTKISKLPPVLNLQLLRFLYDRNTGSKKKLSTKIKFSEVLDLKEYINTENSNESHIYQLGAILMHVGKSAYSGHYMAHIKQFETDEWYCFNDEVIKKIKKRQLGSTDDETEVVQKGSNGISSQEEQITKNSKPKTFSTANAYLLVYYRKDLFDFTNDRKSIDNVSSQFEIKNCQVDIVKNDNAILENWFNELKVVKTQNHENEMLGRVTIRTIYDDLWYNKECSLRDYYFIPTEFLRKFILSSQPDIISLASSIQKYICQHKRLNPFALNRFKLVQRKGLSMILSTFSLGLSDVGAFEADSIENTKCMQCVKNICIYLKLKEQIKNDQKILKNLLKNEEIEQERRALQADVVHDSDINDGLKYYWVGKESLRLWSNLAITKYESVLPTCKFNDANETNGDCTPPQSSADVVIIQSQSTQNDIYTIDDNDTDSADMNLNFSFNEDIRCTHGGLSPLPNKRPISEITMKFLCKYFPAQTFIPISVHFCNSCVENNEVEKVKKDEVKNQKDDLFDLYQNKKSTIF